VDRTATGPALLEQLPPPLPAQQIIALNQPWANPHTTRSYAGNGWTFELPPGVFMPDGTSRMIHEQDPRAIIQHAPDQGLSPEIGHLHVPQLPLGGAPRQDGVPTFLFRLTRGGQA
jgi:hypothetical protein